MILNCDNNFYLRSIEISDTAQLLQIRNSALVKKYFIIQEEITEEQHLRWLQNKVATGDVVQFVICEKEQDTILGSVYLQQIDYTHHKAEFGIFIGSSKYLGKGIGTQITTTMLQYAFSTLHLHRIYLRALATNSRAIACYQKSGFQMEGLLRQDVYIHDSYQDIVLMGAINPDC